MDVAAVAAAEASEGGSADKCVLPFAMPDLWDDRDDDTDPANHVPNEPEWWEFDPGDRYEAFTGPCPPLSPGCNNGTGLGSSFRNDGTYEGDIGRRIWIKAAPKGQKGKGSGGDDGWGAGGTDVMVGPGNFQIWNMPDPDDGCDPLHNGGGAKWVGENILECNLCPITVGEDYYTKPGNVASIKDELEEIMDSDPLATWDQASESVISSNAENWEDSPRVRIVPLWSPSDNYLQGHTTIEFNNMAKIFLEGGGTNPPDFAVYARFLGMVDGGGGGTTTGSLIKYLRLVE